MNEKPIALIEDYRFDDFKNNTWGGRVWIDFLILGKRENRAANFCKFMKMLNDVGVLYDKHNDDALFSHDEDLISTERM